MASLVFLVEQTALGLYIVFGVLAFVLVRRLLRIRRELRASTFELVRDTQRFRQANVITLLVILAQVVIVVAGIQIVVAPSLRASGSYTPRTDTSITDGTFATLTPAPPVNQAIDASGVNLFPTDPADAVFVTPTLTPTPVGTILPNAPPVAGCDTSNAQLQIPANGMRVFEPFSVVGIASVQDFAYYKLEISGASTLNQYAVLLQAPQPVFEMSALGQFVPAPYEYGEYQFRLTVFDITNTLRATCMVTIYITEPPPPTSTPLTR